MGNTVNPAIVAGRGDVEGPAAEVRFCLLGDDEEPMVEDGRSEGAPGSVRERSRGGEGDDCEAVRAQTLKMSQAAKMARFGHCLATALDPNNRLLRASKGARAGKTPEKPLKSYSFLSPHRMLIHTTRGHARENQF